jgi:hypothetical protein
MRRLTALALTCVATVAFARTARADEGDDEPDPQKLSKADAEKREDEAARRAEEAEKDAEAMARAKGVKLTFRLGVRFLSSSPFPKTYQAVLSAYGFDSMSAVVEGAADVAYSPFRYLDFGLHAGYAFGAGGSAGGSAGFLQLHEVETGGFVYSIFGRRDRRRSGDFGAGVEGGAMFPFLVLGGDVSHATVPYIGPVLLGRLFGDSRVQTAVHLRYLVANWANAFSGPVNLPLGGFSISVGANLVF